MEGLDHRAERCAQWLFGGALLLALPGVLIPLGLPSEADAADYRVPMLQWMIRHGTLPDWPWTPVDNYPMLGELLMLPLRALHAGLDRLVPMAACAAIGLCAGALFRRLAPDFGRPGFWIAAALAVTFRPVAIQTNLLMVDNVASAFVLLALVLVVDGRDRWAGLVFGLALATRYSVWPLIAVMCLVGPMQGRGWRPTVRLILLAALPLLPLLVRNTLLEGNPVFPLLTSVLGPADVVIGVGWDQYGRDSRLLGLLLLPFDLLVTNETGHRLFDYTVGRSFLFLLLLTGVFVWRRPGPARGAVTILGRSPSARTLLVFGLAGLGVWCLTGPQLRFAVPQLVVLLVLVLAVFLRTAPRPAVYAVLMAAGLTAVAAQKNTLLIAAGWRPVTFLAEAERARSELDKAGLPPDIVVGWPRRDRVLGFLNRDFVFLSPHPYSLGSERDPQVGWIYDHTTGEAPLRRRTPAR